VTPPAPCGVDLLPKYQLPPSNAGVASEVFASRRCRGSRGAGLVSRQQCPKEELMTGVRDQPTAGASAAPPSLPRATWSAERPAAFSDQSPHHRRLVVGTAQTGRLPGSFRQLGTPGASRSGGSQQAAARRIGRFALEEVAGAWGGASGTAARCARSWVAPRGGQGPNCEAAWVTEPEEQG
jgi:hypothetical protein